MKKITSDLKTMYKSGCAIHWLRPRSKIPMKKGWSKGPRAKWSDLKESFKPGLNPGVRLGAPSKINGAYLAVVDLDIKGDETKHLPIALKALKKAAPVAYKAPRVLSGRGNGSSHFYVRTPEPIKGDAKIKSPDIVKVLMPSVPPTDKERKTLTAKEISKGFRLRPAWEISLMSEGRQAALPGAVHPDTGKKYRWQDKTPDFSTLPLLKEFNSQSVATLRELGESNKAPKVKRELEIDYDVDVHDLRLKPDQLDAIVNGSDVSDRSAMIYALCMAMLQRGVSEPKILGVFTNTDYYLGKAAYEHKRTGNRELAATWVEKYCLAKARMRVEDSLFDVEEIDESSAKGKKRKVDLMLPRGVTEVGGWTDELELKWVGKYEPPIIKSTYLNIRLILGNTCGTGAFLKRDLFRRRDFFTCDTPWGAVENAERSAGTDDALQIKSWLSATYNMEPSLTLIDEVLNTVALENTFHAVIDYLESLTWDGEERIEKAFRTYMGADMPEPYLSDVTRKFFQACIQRIYEPGCKHDDVVIFEGIQGAGKSTFPEILASKEWFMEGLPNLQDKDAALNLCGAWLCEFGELEQFHKSTINVAKIFVARSVDRVRPPYGHRRIDIPRSTVFLGTTDKKDYLVDTAGNRRWLPVKVRGCNFEKLKRDRDQLWAEALFMYHFSKEPLYLTGEAKAQAKEIQETKRVEDEGDAMRERLTFWLDQEREEGRDTKSFTLAMLFESGPFSAFPATRGNTMRAGEILRQEGYEKTHTNRGNLWVEKRVEK